MGIKKAFLLSAACMVISSLSVLGMPFADFESDSAGKIAGYGMGIAFWLFLIAGLLLYRITYKALGNSTKTIRKGRPAILKFFSNCPAVVADIALIVSGIWNIFSAAGMIKTELLNAIFASVIFIAFHLHYMFNGTAFEYIIRNLNKED